MIAVSVIIPVFRAEEYIVRCFQSLCAQTLAGMEFIFVDDCSPDASMELLSKAIAETTPSINCILLYTQQNSGISEARRLGVLAAHGKYVGFCDADDTISPLMFQKLYEVAIRNQSDIAVCDYEMNFPDHTECCALSIASTPQLTLQQAYSHEFFQFNLWNHLVERDLAISAMSEVHPSSYAEDLYTMMHIYYHASRIVHVPEILYYYNKCNRQSVLTKPSLLLSSWQAQRLNIEGILRLLDPKSAPEYQLTCQWLKYRVKSYFQPVFPNLRSAYDEYSECHRDIMEFGYIPYYIRRKLRIIHSSFITYFLYHKVYSCLFSRIGST